MDGNTIETLGFQALSKVLSERLKENSYKEGTRSRILAVFDDLVLVWNKEDGCLVSLVLQSSTERDNNIQTLCLSRPPIWEVERIMINKSGTGVMLVGRRGVAVLELPKRWGSPPLFEGGSDTITCRVEYIGERFFSCNLKVSIVSAVWHPGSFDHSHIVVLASDNYLRIYNVMTREIPDLAVAVALSSNSNATGSRFGGSSALGENAVDFDFGPALEHENYPERSIADKQMSHVIDDGQEDRKRHLELKWPIFILYGNGEVYYTLTTLSKTRPQHRMIYGPLSMTPACSDNYGVDYCSLLALQSSPPVLVIGSSTGRLHHCVVVDKSADDDVDGDFDESTTEPNSMISPERNNIVGFTKVSLHVYESVQLEMSLCTSDSATHCCPLVLHRDVSTPTRYWVSHDAGVHGVVVPVVEKLIEFSILPDESDFVDDECECVVEHLVCTKSLSSTKAMPVVGVGTAPSPASRPHLLVLLATGSLLSLPVTSIHLPAVPEYRTQVTSPMASPLRRVHTESFEEHIRNLLYRSTSQPFLASGTCDAKVNSQEYLTVLTRATETIRKFYLQPQHSAREDIEHRRSMLLDQKERLLQHVQEIQMEKKELSGAAHNLAERYEEANDKHNQLMQRLEEVLSQIVHGLPLLSAAERTMFKELEMMKDNSPRLKNDLSQVKVKFNFQNAQMEKHNNNEAIRAQQSATFSDNQIKCLKMSLAKESEELSLLVEQINSLKKQLHL